METRLISELNHEIAKMKCLAQCIGPYASNKDNQKLRDTLVQTRQRCWELCKHVRDNIVPRLERQNSVPRNNKTSIRSSDRTASIAILSSTLEVLINELRRLHSLVTTFPLKGSKIYTEGIEDMTPIDTFICLTSTGCIITPDIAEVSAAEIRRNMTQMEANRILRDKQEIEEISKSLAHQIEISKRESNENGMNRRKSVPVSRAMSNPIPRRTSMNPVRRTSMPVCCVLYCACRKTYL